MDLLIDGQALQTPSSAHRGIGRYARNLLRALGIACPTWKITVVQNSRLPAIDPGQIAGLSIISFDPPLRMEKANATANELFYGDWLCAQHPDGILLPSIFEREGILPSFIGPRPKLACVLYDLI